MMIKLLFLAIFSSCFLGLSACSTTPQPDRKNLSTQPHNRPESWEGTGGLGSVMGQQYQD